MEAPYTRALAAYIAGSRFEQLPAPVFDLAFAVDALSEVAAVTGGLAPIARVLRPGAALVAGELGPSLFWDIVRGVRPAWWARSPTGRPMRSRRNISRAPARW